MSKKAVLPRLHVYPNKIRARIRNRSIDLIRDDETGGATLRIINASGFQEGSFRTCASGRFGIGYLKIGLSDETLEALEQALLLRRQEWKTQQTP
jgi:hypothetical protein